MHWLQWNRWPTIHFYAVGWQYDTVTCQYENSPYGEKEVRALVNFDPVNESSGEYDKAVHINWIDSILTKPIAGDLGDKNDEVYGTDPVDMINVGNNCRGRLFDFAFQNHVGKSQSSSFCQFVDE